MKDANINHIEIWQNESRYAITINDKINISGIRGAGISVGNDGIEIELLAKKPFNQPVA